MQLRPKTIADKAEITQKLRTGIRLIAAIVKRTLGPGGLPILIERTGQNLEGDPLEPMITKDGVTVANECAHEDEQIDLAIQTVKAICKKTNRLAGDGTTTAIADVGGLVGYTHKIVTNCYSEGTVTASGREGEPTSIGGLVGLQREPDSVISNSYSTANVISEDGNYQTGGFIGINKDTVYNCYSTGNVSAAAGSYAGGFCGLNQGSINNCFWDEETSGETSSRGGTAKTTAEMMQWTTFEKWDFDEIWYSDQGQTYPFLRTIEGRK